MAIETLGRYSYAFTLWKAQELGYTVLQSSSFYALFNLIYALSAYPVGLYSKRVSKKGLIGAGFLLSALASLFFALAGVWPFSLWPSFSTASMRATR